MYPWATLTKLDRSGKTMRSVELAGMGERMSAMRDNGLCLMRGTMGGQYGPRASNGPGTVGGQGRGMMRGRGGPRGGGGPGRMASEVRGPMDENGGPLNGKRPAMMGGNSAAMMHMHQMRMAKVMSSTSITADGDGVHVLRAGETTTYDNDPNEVRIAEVLSLGADPAEWRARRADPKADCQRTSSASTWKATA